jgi:hypothetical protein
MSWRRGINLSIGYHSRVLPCAFSTPACPYSHYARVPSSANWGKSQVLLSGPPEDNNNDFDRVAKAQAVHQEIL